jgi:hypothetical protein
MSTLLTGVLKEQGYDGIEIGGDRILVIIFDKKRIATFKSERL